MAHNLFLDNPYLILGLDTDATEKEIVRRGRELDKILAIGEKPSYEQDFDFSSKRRTKKSVEGATKRLLDTKNELIDTFFWFEIHTTSDRVAIRYCRRGEWLDGIGVWDKKIAENQDDIKSLEMIRNRAIAESILFSENHAKKWLRTSLKDWCYLIDSDKQWELFYKVFRLKNPSVDDAIMERFRDKAKDYLADYFFRTINDSDADDDCLSEVYEALGTYGSSYESEIIAPKADRLRELISEADSWRKEIKGGGGLNNEYYTRINNLREEIDTAAGEIQELGEDIWDRGDIKSLRNDCSNSINFLCNALCARDEIQGYPSRIDAVLKILKLGYNIAPSDSAIERQIIENRDIIRSVRFFAENKNTYDRILERLRIGDRYGARRLINELLGEPDIDDKSKEELEGVIRKIGFTPQPTRSGLSSTSTASRSSSNTYTPPTYNQYNYEKPKSSDPGEGILGAIISFVVMVLILWALSGCQGCQG